MVSRIQRSAIIMRPAAEIYAYCTAPERLAGLLPEAIAISPAGDSPERPERGQPRRLHWEMRGPAGCTLRWTTALDDDVPGKRLRWRTLPGADLDHRVLVELQEQPNERGTVVRVTLEFRPPAGPLGGLLLATVGRITGRTPEQEMAEALRRLRASLEAGEVPSTAGQPSGRARAA